MASPTIVTLPPNRWTLVASNVNTGIIDRDRRQDKIDRREIYQTYRTTGESAPQTLDEAVLWDSEQAAISATVAIDVYMYSAGQEAKVRVSI